VPGLWPHRDHQADGRGEPPRGLPDLRRAPPPHLQPAAEHHPTEDPRYSFFDRELELGEVRDPGDRSESGGADATPPPVRVDHSAASYEAERNLHQAVAAALAE
jgi:hypothetical protein